MTKLKPERALGYVRVSTQRQAEGGISLDNQEERLTAHYAQRGIELVDIYRDGGLSGTTDNRPGLQALFEHALRPGAGITEIGVYSFSRLFRDHYLLEHYRRRLKRAGVRIVAITQDVGQDAEGDLVRSVLSNFEEYQSRQTAKFTRDTMMRNAEAGFWNGAVPPFGYRTRTCDPRITKASDPSCEAPGFLPILARLRAALFLSPRQTQAQVRSGFAAFLFEALSIGSGAKCDLRYTAMTL